MTPLSTITIEVCVDSLGTAIAAAEAGADRLELNVALPLDGLTPSPGLVQSVLEAVSIPVIAMVRPRAGDFVYSETEFQTMLRDAEWLIQAGVAGLAFGALTADQRLDQDRMAQLIQLCQGRATCVMHRAFDDVVDPEDAIQELARMGVHRVMTSGRARAVTDALEVVRQLSGLAGDRLGLLPAGGIDEDNAERVVLGTGVRQIHGSFSAGGTRTPAEIGAAVRKTRERLDRLA